MLAQYIHQLHRLRYRCRTQNKDQRQTPCAGWRKWCCANDNIL